MQLYKAQIVYGDTVLISLGLYTGVLYKTFIINFMKQNYNKREITSLLTDGKQQGQTNKKYKWPKWIM